MKEFNTGKQFNINEWQRISTNVSQSLSKVQTDATFLANNSQHCWMLHVASVCTPCCMLLGVVAQTQQLQTLLGQQCWKLLRLFAGSFRSFVRIYQSTCMINSPRLSNIT